MRYIVYPSHFGAANAAVISSLAFLVFSVRFIFSLGCMLCAVCASVSVHADGRQSVQGYTLRIEMAPALCQLQPQRSKLRQCKEGFSLAVSGLRPDPLQFQGACSDKRANLAPLQTKVVSRIMPDAIIRDLAWQRYGSCVGFSSREYFHRIAKLSGDLKIPKELSSGSHYKVNKNLFINQLLAQNSSLKRAGVKLVCQKDNRNLHLLTELQICYNAKTRYAPCLRQNVQSCPDTFIIRGLP